MAIQSVNWDDLRIFLEVGRHKTLSAASRHLGVDDSTVSRRVAHLEARLGATLFVRGRQGLEFTPRADRLLALVREMESSVLAIGDLGSQDETSPKGRVRVDAIEGIASPYLASALAMLVDKHPDLEIELMSSCQQLDISRREADISLSFSRSEGRGFSVEAIGEVDFHLYGSDHYLRRWGVPHSTEDLSNHVFASFVDNMAEPEAVGWLRDVAPKHATVFHAQSVLSQMLAAAAGVGLVMVPEFASAERFGLQRVLCDQLCVSRTLWLSVHRDLEFTPRVKVVTQFIRAALERDCSRLCQPLAAAPLAA